MTTASLRRAVALALAASPLVAGPAFAGAAEDAFASFRDFCGVPQGDYQAALDKADAGGWKHIDFTSDTMNGVKITDKASRNKVAGAEAMALSVTRGTAGKPGDVVNVTTCTVTAKADFSAVAKLTGEWLALAPHDSSASKVGFRYTPNGASATAVADSAYQAAAAANGYVMLSIADKGNGLAMIDMVKLKK
ncbi:hypothetical protein ACO2Q3_26140 [Caulobacter sp. KR2-114]|uniref:hypothetical protein n=1 Tax=Caulobacter sp. KR2-114 TaxID=3400912 RepID=UPI003C08F68C